MVEIIIKSVLGRWKRLEERKVTVKKTLDFPWAEE